MESPIRTRFRGREAGERLTTLMDNGLSERSEDSRRPGSSRAGKREQPAGIVNDF
jgi:hypothetical protein